MLAIDVLTFFGRGMSGFAVLYMAVVLLVVGAIVGAACALGPSPPPLWILAVLGGGVLFALELVLWGSAASGGLALGDAGRGLEAPRKPRSYFVRDLFVDVVFPDRDVAVRSAAARKKDRLLRLATACGAMAAAAAFLLLPISSYLDNRHFAQGALSFVEKLAEAREGGGRKGEGAALTAKGLEAVAPNLGQLAQFETSGPNLMMGWGLYVGDKLMNPLARAVSQLLLQPLVEHDASVLADLLKGKAADPDPFGALVAYMLLTQPKEPGEPSPEASDWSSKWIGRAADAAADRWEKVSGERASKKARQAVRDGVSFVLLRQRKAGEDLALPERRSEVVKRVRQILDAANESDPIAAFIKDPTMPRDVRLRDIVGAQVMLFRSSDNQADAGPSLPGAFTPDGWRGVAKRLKRLVEDEDDDDMAWVLGSPNDQKEKRQASAGPLQTSYFRRYIDAWRAFLLSLSMKEQPTLEGARGMISTLLSTKALDALWRTAEKNLVIKDESPLGLLQKRAEGALQKRANELREKILGKKTEEGSGKKKRLAGDEPDEPAAVEAEYAAFLAFGRGRQQGQQPGLELYYQILNEVQGALGESGAPDAKAFQGVYRTQLTKLRGLANQYNDNGWEGQLLLKLLMPPLGSAEAAVVGAGGDSANRKWCENIVVAWDQQLAGRYPFVTGKDVRDARVPDIEKFFQPGGGTLWQYFGEALKGDIDHPSGTTVFRPKEESSVRYRPDLIDFLEKAQRLTDALFAGKEPGKLYVPVRVRLKPSPPYVRITFKTGSKSVLYFNQKERWEEVGWPNAGAYLVSDFKGAQSETGFKNIEMGLFHLLDQGSVQRKSEDEDFLAAVFSPDDGQGKINADFQPAGLTKLFKGLTVPRAVVAGAKPCAR
jgi:type VI secretion system protein ImpL